MSSELKNSIHHNRKDETLPSIEISTPTLWNNSCNQSPGLSDSGFEQDLNHLHSPEDLQPRRIPQEHHFRIDSKTRNSSRVYSPLIPPVFREVSSWSSFVIQAMFGVVCLWLIVEWIFPRFLVSTTTPTNSSKDHNNTEEQYTKSLLMNSFELIVIIHVLIDGLINCAIPTLLRFTLAEHTFRNLKSNIVNTNQFLSFQYPRTILKIFLRPFWIFYCSMVMIETATEGGSIRMIVFLIASIVGFCDVQNFLRSVLFLQYKIDEVSKFIYVDVEYKENFKPPRSVATVLLTALLPILLVVHVVNFHSFKNILVFGLSAIVFLTADNAKHWPEALRYNIRFLLYGLSQVGLVWTMHQL